MSMQASQMNAARREPTADQKRILIADDEVAFLLALKKILQGPDVFVDTAETIEDALGLLKEQHYSVVIADVMLTMVLREEGLEILQYVKEHAPDTKVIILTGYGKPSIMKKASSLGADLFFEKPVPPHVLQNTLRCWGIGC